jgi:hypothetical protein
MKGIHLIERSEEVGGAEGGCLALLRLTAERAWVGVRTSSPTFPILGTQHRIAQEALNVGNVNPQEQTT